MTAPQNVNAMCGCHLFSTKVKAPHIPSFNLATFSQHLDCKLGFFFFFRGKSCYISYTNDHEPVLATTVSISLSLLIIAARYIQLKSLCSMFPFQQNSDEFWPQIFSNPYQEDIGKDFQDLIYGQDSLHGISNQTISVDEIQKHKILATSKANDHSGKIIRDEKKIARKEIERQRRQHISTLHASLRNLLPLESIKVKKLFLLYLISSFIIQ